MSKFLLFALLFILPFAVIPFGTSQFELPKIIVSQFLIDALLIILLVKKGGNYLKSFDRVQLITFGIIALISVYHLVFLTSPITFFGNASRLQGVLLLWQLMIFSLISSRVKILKVPTLWYQILLIITLILSLLLGNQNARAIATLGEPNALAAFVIFLWPFTLHPWGAGFVYYGNKNSSKNWMVYSAAAVSLFIILLSGSRSGLIAFSVQIIFILLYTKFKFSLKKTVLVVLTLIILSYALPLFEAKPYENRIDVWKNAATSGLYHPLLGAGFGNTQIQMHKTSVDTQDKLAGYYVDSGHNIFLDWWIQAGVVGVGVVVFLVLNTIRSLYYGKKTLELVIFFGLLTVISFNPAGIVALLGFWWLIGQGFARDS